MSKYIRALNRTSTWPAALVFATMLAACGGDQKGDDTLAQDTSLSRDLARVGGDTAVQPQLQDGDTAAAAPAPEPEPAPTPAPARPRPRPTRPRPTPTNPAPAPVTPAPPPTTASGNTVEKGPGTAERSGSISSGTVLTLNSADKVCTNTNKVGDRFIATLASDVSGSNGTTIPAGATVTIELTQLKRSENANDQIQMGFRVINLSFGGKTYPLEADVQTAEIARVRASSGGNDAKKVVGGAVAGAVIGQILGKKSKSTIIGAAAGAAAGGAAAAATANYEGCVNSGGNIVVRLNAPVTIAVT